MRRFLHAFAVWLLSVSLAWAQTGFGNIPNRTVLGNSSGATAAPQAIPFNYVTGVIGAVADWNGTTGTDNQSVFQSQLNVNCTLILPPGRFRLASGLSTTCQSVVIAGAGLNATEIVFDGTIATGININHTSGSFNQFYSVQVINMTIATTQAPGGTAIALAGLASVGPYREHARTLITDVQFIGDTQYTQGWATGVSFTDVQNVSIVGTNFTGLGGDPAHQLPTDLTKSTTAIAFTGGASIPDEIHITNVIIYNWATGIAIGGQTQGVYVVNTTMDNINTGINWTAVGGVGGQLLIFGNGTIAAFQFGINVTGVTQINVHDSLFLQDTRATGNANQIQLVNVTKGIIHHTHFWSANTVFPVNAVVLGGVVTDVQVLDNYYESAAVGAIFYGVDIPMGTANTRINVDTDPGQCIGTFAGACFNVVGGGAGTGGLPKARIADTALTTHQWFSSVAAGVPGKTQPAYPDIGIGPAPTSVTACGAGSPSVVGGNSAGTVTTGAGASTSCQLNFSVAFATAPHCVATAGGATTWTVNAVPATGSVVFNYASATSLAINYICAGT